MSEGSNSKQYDNIAFVVYGVVHGHLALWRHRGDPLDLLPAIRAGQRLIPKSLNTYYKSGLWWSAYRGLSFLALYEATGDPLWLEQAVSYARTIEGLQQPSGTWTYYHANKGTLGQSFSRDDRSGDMRPLFMPEFMLFLGQLRAAGVTDFVEVEERAQA
jgi:hypothetical protein